MTLSTLSSLYRSITESTPAAAAAKTYSSLYASSSAETHRQMPRRLSSPTLHQSLMNFFSSSYASSASPIDSTPTTSSDADADVKSHKRPQPSKPLSPEDSTRQVSHDISSKLSEDPRRLPSHEMLSEDPRRLPSHEMLSEDLRRYEKENLLYFLDMVHRVRLGIFRPHRVLGDLVTEEHVLARCARFLKQLETLDITQFSSLNNIARTRAENSIKADPRLWGPKRLDPRTLSPHLRSALGHRYQKEVDLLNLLHNTHFTKQFGRVGEFRPLRDITAAEKDWADRCTKYWHARCARYLKQSEVDTTQIAPLNHIARISVEKYLLYLKRKSQDRLFRQTRCTMINKLTVHSIKLGNYYLEDGSMFLLTVNGNTEEDGEILFYQGGSQGIYIQRPPDTRTDYQLIEICEDGFVRLLTENGNTKDDVRLPTDESLLTQIKDGFGEGKDLVVTVASHWGEEQIVEIKDNCSKYDVRLPTSADGVYVMYPADMILPNPDEGLLLMRDPCL